MQLEKVSKKYGKSVILDQIDLDIKKGVSIALTGHNGCGKSTLLRILCGLTSINGGRFLSCRNLKFNYVPEHFPELKMTVRQYLMRVGKIEGMSGAEIEKECQRYFELFRLGGMEDTSIEHLSKGSRQKVNVIQALLVKPDILLLDEPLSGQDTWSQKQFIQIIRNMTDQGVAVIMSCHEDFLINALSDIKYEIKEKKLFRQEHKKMDGSYVRMLFVAPNDDTGLLSEINSQVLKYEANGQDILIYAKEEDSNPVIQTMMQAGCLLKEMNSETIL